MGTILDFHSQNLQGQIEYVSKFVRLALLILFSYRNFRP